MRAKSDILEDTGTRQGCRGERCRKIQPLRNLNNNSGSAIVLALMLLSLLTVMGIWSTRKSNVETLIAGNEVARKQTFFRTEGGVIEGGFRIEETDPGVLAARSPDWLYEASIAPDMTDPDNWEFQGDPSDDTAVASDLDSEVGYCALDKGVTSGDSLVMTGATQVRTYAVYSFHDSRDGQSLMEVGYKRRF